MQSRTFDDEIFSKISHIFFSPETETEALVIRMHGLPGRSPFSETQLLGKCLTDVGIAFFAFDFPGIRKSEGYYTYRNSYNIAKKVLDYFATEHEEIYPKIGIYGESFGGSISVCLTNFSSIVSALFLWSPVLNFNFLSSEIQIPLIIKFMEDSGAIRLPHYDDFAGAFATQLQLNPPENSHGIFNRIPTKIMCSDTDLLFPPDLIKKQLNEQYHKIISEEKGLDHNLSYNNAAIKISNIATDFFIINLLG